MCQNHIPNSCPRTFSSCRQSGAFSVQGQQAARTYPVVTSRSRMCPMSDRFACPGIVLSSLSQCSVSRAPCAWSATPLSFTWWHWWPALGDERRSLSVYFVCTSFRVSVVAVTSAFVWRARAWNWAQCSSADLRRRPPTDAMFEEVLKNPKQQQPVSATASDT